MKNNFDIVITAKNNPFRLKLFSITKYKDLIWLFVQRDFKLKYKQTVLGPLWFIIQPLLTTLIYTVVFGVIAGMQTEGVPKFLFYLAGNVPWLFFSACLIKTSSAFLSNARLFSKVYFPRLCVPVAEVITQMLNFFIQFALFLIIELVFFLTGTNVRLGLEAALFPLSVLQLGLLGMGFGIIISSLTVKYRDLQFLVSFGVSLWMYITPVIYSASSILAASETLYIAVMLNPVSSVIELIRCGFLGVGSVPWLYYGISWLWTVVVLLLGLMLFNRTEKNFTDVI